MASWAARFKPKARPSGEAAGVVEKKTVKKELVKPLVFKTQVSRKKETKRNPVVAFAKLGEALSENSNAYAKFEELPRRGLQNLRNQCFRNAVVQSLGACASFNALFQKISSLKFKENDSSHLKSICKFYKEMWLDPIISRKELAKKAEAINKRNAQLQNGDLKKPLQEPQKEKKKLSKAMMRRLRKKKRESKSREVDGKTPVASNGQKKTSSPSKPQNDLPEVQLPSYEAESLGIIQEDFQKQCIGQQEDAQEFFHFLVQSLHEDMLQVLNSQMSSKNIKQEDDGWNEVGKKSKTFLIRNEIRLVETPISKLFGGTLRFELRKRGMKNTVSTQPFYELPLEIHAPEINTLVDALRSFMTPGRITGLRHRGNQVEASQRALIAPPKILVIHLKRFLFCKHRGGEKIEKYISYPPVLKLPSGVLYGVNSHRNFALKSVVVHSGKSLQDGHYTAFVRSQKRCYCFDDEKVLQTSGEEMLSQQAYLLFYEAV
mmetsp:Transcript_4303/g.6434  ORF Transcript_4303/g.6434 Transcript_4303/m.6434 type:complete len:489 (+) Transcript_4303:9-1475(+)